MGAGIAITLGGRPVVLALAFLAACAIDRIQRLMAQRRFPDFYQQIAGGAVATLIAVAAAGVGIEVNPSRVVTAGIVMLLAGIGVMGATQDAILGFPVTASARLMDALLATTGIIGGVSGAWHSGAARGRVGTFNPGAVGAREQALIVSVLAWRPRRSRTPPTPRACPRRRADAGGPGAGLAWLSSYQTESGRDLRLGCRGGRDRMASLRWRAGSGSHRW